MAVAFVALAGVWVGRCISICQNASSEVNFHSEVLQNSPQIVVIRSLSLRTVSEAQTH